LTTSETVFVFARVAGVTHPVGRYEFTPTEFGPPAAQFRYGQSWLRDEGGVSFALDPVNLPLRQGPFTEPQRSGLFGPLADATPDAWGRRLIQLDKPNVLLSAPQLLLATGDDRVGCLAFSSSLTPPDRQSGHADTSSLDRIASEFERIQRGEQVDPRYEHLYRAGKSLGGARPKAVIEFDGALWIAKFQKHDDEFDQCMAEHAAICLARDCGIEVAETRMVSVGSQRAVLVKRFDRAEGPAYEPSAHYLSALSLLNFPETSSQGSYSDIAQEILKFTTMPHDGRRELFARMVFNVACGNRDDHLKNHALLYSEGGWRLSPAFDIVPQPDMYPTQAIGVGKIGKYPSRANCVSLAGNFSLTFEQAEEIVERIAEVVADWRERFKSYGADDVTIGQLARAFMDLRKSAPAPTP
jgi:serine/threonine-protein kinase HipA